MLLPGETGVRDNDARLGCCFAGCPSHIPSAELGLATVRSSFGSKRGGRRAAAATRGAGSTASIGLATAAAVGSKAGGQCRSGRAVGASSIGGRLPSASGNAAVAVAGEEAMGGAGVIPGATRLGSSAWGAA